MGFIAPGVLLIAPLLGGVLLTAAGIIALARLCPRTSQAHRRLFERASDDTSFRGRFLLPWPDTPDFAGCRPVARWFLALARVGAAITLITWAVLIRSGGTQCLGLTTLAWESVVSSRARQDSVHLRL
jgi:hypothetical protein